MTPPIRLHRSVVAVVGLLMLIAAACQGGAGGSKAERIFRDKTADSQVAEYAFAIAAGTPSAAERQVMIDALNGEQYKISLAAAQALVDSDDPAVKEAMRTAFENKRGAIKLYAAMTLARDGDEQAKAWLLGEATSGGRLNPDAIALLADLGVKDELQGMLTTWMHSDDQATRDEAYGVLGAIKQPWAVPMLLDGLKNEHGETRLQPIVSLGHTGDPEVASKIVPFVNTQGLVFASLEALGALGNESSLKAIQPMLDHEEPLVRVYAGTAAWRLGDEELAAPVLEPLVVDEDPVVRRNLAEQLAPIDAPGATQMLVRLAGDDDRDVRIAALRALSGRSGSEVESALIAATEATDYQVASAALDALADTGGAGALAAAKARLGDENPYVVVAAAHAVLALQAKGTTTAG